MKKKINFGIIMNSWKNIIEQKKKTKITHIKFDKRQILY